MTNLRLFIQNIVRMLKPLARAILHDEPFFSRTYRGTYPRHNRWVVIVVHDFSATGSPFIGYELAKEIGKSFNTLVVCLGDGALAKSFETTSNIVLYPGFFFRFPHFLFTKLGVRRLAGVPVSSLDYVVFNSIETVRFREMFGALGTAREVCLVHEFISERPGKAQKVSTLDAIHRLVFPSIATLRDAAKYLNEKTRALVTRQPVRDLETEQESRPRETLPISIEGKKIVLGAGSVSFRKGVDLFVEIARQVEIRRPHDYIFIWCGEGYDPSSDSYSQSVFRQLEEADPRPNVVFAGAVEVGSTFRIATALLLTSRQDPHPNVGLEALSMGLPVITFDEIIGTSELLKQFGRQDLIVSFPDTVKAAEVILGLMLTEQKISEELSEAASGSWDNYWGKIRDFVNE